MISLNEFIMRFPVGATVLYFCTETALSFNSAREKVAPRYVCIFRDRLSCDYHKITSRGMPCEGPGVTFTKFVAASMQQKVYVIA